MTKGLEQARVVHEYHVAGPNQMAAHEIDTAANADSEKNLLRRRRDPELRQPAADILPQGEETPLGSPYAPSVLRVSSRDTARIARSSPLASSQLAGSHPLPGRCVNCDSRACWRMSHRTLSAPSGPGAFSSALGEPLRVLTKNPEHGLEQMCPEATSRS